MSHEHVARCGICGKFISDWDCENRVKVRFVHVPDTHFTEEETYWVHIECETHPEAADG